MTFGRYFPTIVLIVWVLLIAGGVSAGATRVPGMIALAISFLFFLPAERNNARSERRTGEDRRNHDSST